MKFRSTKDKEDMGRNKRGKCGRFFCKPKTFRLAAKNFSVAKQRAENIISLNTLERIANLKLSINAT